MHLRQGLIVPLLRIAFLTVLCIGLVLPRMSAALVEILPNVTYMVICTGEELVMWTIGPDGQPIKEVEKTQHHCIMADGVVIAGDTSGFWTKLTQEFAFGFAVREHQAPKVTYFTKVTPVRGPPHVA